MSNHMSLWVLLPGVLVFALLLTWVLRRYALSRSLMDIPNARSSHSVPTPRGGGVAIVLAYLAVLPVVGYQGWLSWAMVVGLMGSGAWIAIFVFLYVFVHFVACWCLLVHSIGAGWLMAWLAALRGSAVVGKVFDLGLLVSRLGALMLVWLLNLYNFM